MARRWRRVIAAAIVVAIMIGVIVWRMTWAAPAWYAPPAANDQSVIDLADRVEYRMVQEAQKVRAPAEARWTLRVREEQINAWLAARLSKWIVHQTGSPWPDHLGTPQAHIDAQGVSVAIPLLNDSRSRFLTARITPSIENGKLRVELNRVALGRIGLPGEPLANLLDRLGQTAPGALDLPQAREALDWLRRREAIEPVIHLADQRQIRLLNLKLDEGWIDITAQTSER